jgi:hypothetical protein
MEISYKKKTTFYVLNPLQFWEFFWTRLGILRSPMWFVFEKANIDETISGEIFVRLLLKPLYMFGKTPLAILYNLR